jgi:hypothetical protein
MRRSFRRKRAVIVEDITNSKFTAKHRGGAYWYILKNGVVVMEFVGNGADARKYALTLS